MYYIDDRSAAIRDVQRFLFVISQNEENGIPHLSVDGFYSEETKEAVKAFQKLHLLTITGIVERETFDMLYEDYLKITDIELTQNNALDRSVFPLKIGESGNDISSLNAMIRELSYYYPDLPLPYGDFYSKNTENAVKSLERYLRREETGIVTEELLNIFKREIRERQKFKKT